MLFEPPHYPQIVLSFDYRGWTLQLDQDHHNDERVYSVWAKAQYGVAIAVPCSYSREEAVRRAKAWVDDRLA
ncbi:MAG: hypothetical protein AAGF24_12290 [Cyanobacteria bacterium P01_H01_bin.121]